MYFDSLEFRDIFSYQILLTYGSGVRIHCLVKLFESVILNLNRCLSVLCYQVTTGASHTTHLNSLWSYILIMELLEGQDEVLGEDEDDLTESEE